MNKQTLEQVHWIIFRKHDQAFRIETEEHEVISMSPFIGEDWAPGFSGVCAINFVTGVMAVWTGHQFTAVADSVNREQVVYVRQMDKPLLSR